MQAATLLRAWAAQSNSTNRGSKLAKNVLDFSESFVNTGKTIIGVNTLRVVAEIPGANIKEFLVTILSEAKRPQIQCLSLKGEI
jgi:hypothetical protein